MSGERLTYLNERGESVIFSRFSPYHTNISKDVLGMSDIRSQLHSFSGMGQDGDTPLGSRIMPRDIEIRGSIKERDKRHTRQLRRRLSSTMNPHFSSVLIYENEDIRRIIKCKLDDAITFTSGVVFENFTILLSCLSPFWESEIESRDDIAAWIGAFEFPLPDGLELCLDEGWEISYREPSLIVNVYNGGEVSTGMRVDFRALGMVSNPSLLNVNTREIIKLNIEMIAGDVLSVSTGYGEKSVTLRRGADSFNGFRYLDISSSYMQLAVGDNLFRYDALRNLENLEVSIYHKRLYLGV